MLVVVLGPAQLSQGGSLSGWISPDLLLVLIIAFCIVEVLFSFPVENRSVKSLAKAAFPVIVVGAYALWSFQGTLVQNSSVAENNVEVVDGVQVINSTLQAGRYPDITVQAGVPVKWVIDAPDGSINGCNNRILISDYGFEMMLYLSLKNPLHNLYQKIGQRNFLLVCCIFQLHVVCNPII